MLSVTVHILNAVARNLNDDVLTHKLQTHEQDNVFHFLTSKIIETRWLVIGKVSLRLQAQLAIIM